MKKIGPDAEIAVLRALPGTATNYQHYVVGLLGTIGTERSITDLEKYAADTKSRSFFLQKAAAEALNKIRIRVGDNASSTPESPREPDNSSSVVAWKFVKFIDESGPDSEETLSLMHALNSEELGEADAYDVARRLATCLDCDRTDVVTRSLELFSEFKFPAAVTAITRHMNAGDDMQRVRALHALAFQEVETAATDVLKYFDDENDAVRDAATRCLQKIGGAVESELAKKFRDSDKSTKLRILAVLAKVASLQSYGQLRLASHREEDGDIKTKLDEILPKIRTRGFRR